MPITYVHEMVHSGAETLSNQLANSPVAKAGPSGQVKMAFVATDGTNTGFARGRKSGRIVIPEGSHAVPTGTADNMQLDSRHVIYSGSLLPDEEIDLEVVAATASTSRVLVVIDGM